MLFAGLCLFDYFVLFVACSSQILEVPSSNYPSLQSALSNANPFDVIAVVSDTLPAIGNCDLIISIPISIVGVSGSVLIDCSQSSSLPQSGRCLAISGASQVSIQGIWFRGGRAPDSSDGVADSFRPPTFSIDTPMTVTNQRRARRHISRSSDSNGRTVEDYNDKDDNDELRAMTSNYSSIRSYSISDNVGGCIAVFQGSQVFMTNVRITNCFALRGGGLSVVDSYVSLNTSWISDNTATASSFSDAIGAGVFLFNSSNSRIQFCVFQNNMLIANSTTNAHGPALAILMSKYLVMSNITATNNTAIAFLPASVYSSALVLYDTPYLSLSGFSGCRNRVSTWTTGEVVGGDIFCNRCSFSNLSDIVVSGSTYAANLVEKSLIGGGLVFRYTVNVRLTRSTVEQVSISGPTLVLAAGIELRGLDSFVLRQIVVRNNTIMSPGTDAMYAGGIRIRSCRNMALYNLTIANNTAVPQLSASIYGAALYIGSSSPVVISGLIADGNSVKADLSQGMLQCRSYTQPPAVYNPTTFCNELQVVNTVCGSLMARRPSEAIKYYFCPWKLTPGNELTLLFMTYQLVLTAIEIYSHPECAYDSLSLYDGPSTYSALIGRYCGSLSKNGLICSDGQCPALSNITSTSGRVVIEFAVSDYSDQFFRINWTAIPIQRMDASNTAIDIDDDANTMDQAMRPPATVALGAAGYITDSTVSIEYGTISRNSIIHPLYSAGAGLYLSTNAVVSLNQVSFVQNSVQSIMALGGAIATTKGSVLSLDNSIILSNNAYGTGTCIILDSLICPNAWGGAIAVTLNSVVNVRRSIFSENGALCSGLNGKCSARGGSVSVGLGGVVSVVASSILRGKAMVGGGIFIVGSASRAEMIGSECSWNYCQCEDRSCTASVTHAGGCLAAQAGNISIQSSNLVDNTVFGTGGGGAIAAMGSCHLVVANSRINNNTALEGGALYQKDTAAARISKCRLEQNEASFVGGAISASGNIRLALDTTMLVNNVAIRASAIWAYGEGNISFSNVSVWSNSGSIATIVGNVQGASNTIWNCSQPDGILSSEEANEFYSQQCSPCSEGTYTVAPAVSNYGYEQQCRPCPTGGSCKLPSADHTGLRSTAGYWGEANTTSGLVQFYLCPSEYCCPFGRLCDYDHCQGNRVGRLCGACPQGMGFRFLTTACVSNDNCRDLAWVIIVIVLASVVGCFFLLKAQRENSNGLVAPLMFFYQVAPLVKSSQWIYVSPVVLSIIQSIFLVSPSGTSGGPGICIISSMTAAQKTAARLIVPGIVVVVLMVMFVAHTVFHRSGIVAVERMTHHGPPCFVQYLGAFVRFVSIAYTSFALAALEAMQCVRIGPVSVWWYNANVECYEGWQGAAIAAFIVLSPVPLIIIVVMHRWKSVDQISEEWKREVRSTLMRGIKESVRWWLGISLYRRLLIVLVYSMIIDNIWKSMAMTTICCAFLVLQVAARPFNKSSAQMVEIWCLLALCILSISSQPALQYGTITNATQEQALEWIQLILYISPGVVCFCIYCKRLIATLSNKNSKQKKVNQIHEEEEQQQQQQQQQQQLVVRNNNECYDFHSVLINNEWTVYC